MEPREIEAAGINHRVEIEPVRQSVIGAGRPVAVRPPAAVIRRAVVAQKTPPAAPRSFETRQAQAGGHLNQSTAMRPEAQPQRPVPLNGGGRSQDGFRPFTQPTGGKSAGT